MQLIFHLIYYLGWSLILPVLYLMAHTIKSKWKPGLDERLGKLDEDLFPQVSKFSQAVNEVDMAKPIWFHAVSVGELNALMPLFKFFAGVPMLLSVTTHTAYKLAQAKLKDEIENNQIKLIYKPWDHPSIVKSTLDRINPSAIVLMEGEIWPGLIMEASRRSIYVTIINAKISDFSFKLYRFFAIFFKPIFRKLSLILGQSPQDSRKYIEMGVNRDRVYMMGNMKFSSLPNISRDKARIIRELLGYSEDDIIWVCGSTHPEEEPLLVSIFQELKPELPNLRLIIAPRHPERFDVVETVINSAAHLIPVKLSMIKKTMNDFIKFVVKQEAPTSLIELAYQCYKADNDSVDLADVLHSSMAQASGDRHAMGFREWLKSVDDVLLVDTIGDLIDVYSFADLALVGGTIIDTVGGHNVLEPASCGLPVLVGPHYFKNREMVEMMENGGALQVAEAKEDLRFMVRAIVNDIDKRVLMGAEAKSLVEKHKRIVFDIAEKLKGVLYDSYS